LEELERELTFTVVVHTMPEGVPVIEKLLVALLLLLAKVKKAGSVDPSFWELMSILTPAEGMVEVILTTSGKSGPGAAACTELLAGVNSTTKPASEEPPPPLFLQEGISKKKVTITDSANNVFSILLNLVRPLPAGGT
jgi:hypothetical protein